MIGRHLAYTRRMTGRLFRFEGQYPRKNQVCHRAKAIHERGFDKQDSNKLDRYSDGALACAAVRA